MKVDQQFWIFTGVKVISSDAKKHGLRVYLMIKKKKKTEQVCWYSNFVFVDTDVQEKIKI